MEIRPIRDQCVMHIFETRRDRQDPVAGAVSDLYLEVATCSDVYGALARLSRSAVSRFGVVLVCVDWLAAREFEFFSLARRLRPDLQVLAYSATDCGRRVRRAISHGATGSVEPTHAAIAAVLEGVATRVSSGDQPRVGGARPALHSAMGGELASESEHRLAAADDGTHEAEERFADSSGNGSATGPLLTQEEIDMLLFGGGEAEAAGERKGLV